MDGALAKIHRVLPDALRRRVKALAELVDADRGTLLRMRVSSLDWMARVLAGLDCSFTIHRPDELRASVQAIADRLTVCAESGPAPNGA